MAVAARREVGDHGRPRVVVLRVRVLSEVGQPETGRGLLVVGADEAIPVAVAGVAADAQTARLRPPSLHAESRLDARDHVGARDVAGVAPGEHLGAIGVAAAEVEQVDACKGDEEAAEQGEGVDGFGCVEALEEDEGGA